MKYITRASVGIIVVDRQEYIIETGLIQYVNELCINNLSTYQGRIDAARILFHISHNVPLFVNHNILLIPTKSIREMDMYYINYHRVIGIQQKENKILFMFDDATTLEINCSYLKMRNQMKKGERLLNHLNR